MEPNLSTREIFLKIMKHEPCYRTIDWEFGYWGGTLNRWYTESLTRVTGLAREVLCGEPVLGPGSPYPATSVDDSILRDTDVSVYFGFDESLQLVPYNNWIFPKYDQRIISENDIYIEIYGMDGIRMKVLKDASSMPEWLEWPVKTRTDWEQVKEERFNFNTISQRYAKDIDTFIKSARNRTFPLGILGGTVGFFGSIRFLIGDVNLFYLYYDDPNLVRDILNHLCDLWIAMSEDLTAKFDFDVACFWEDMSYKNASLISPSIFKEFMTPCYKKIIDFLKGKGIKFYVVDTDGNVDELIPLFLEVGMTAMYPFERQAGNNLLEIRREYHELTIMGGFDKNVLSKDKEAIDRELQNIRQMVKKGGYIPFADHLIPPNVPWENFKYYRNRLKEIIYSTEVL